MSNDKKPQPKSLIEDFLPVREISVECVREKLGGHHISRGMPRNLHLWWARRPLAAARAAIYATFAPPVPPAERAKLGPFFTQLSHWEGPVLPETEALKKAREVVSKAADGKRPVVLDMFAGGGAIPLEAQRLGAQAVALDLNPVAYLILRCTLEYPQRYGQRLHDAVKKWGEWVIEETRKSVGDLYPDIPVPTADKDLFGKAEKLRPIAYLWTRTIPSPARGFEDAQVPLVRQTWLRKKKGKYVALRPKVDKKKREIEWELLTSSANSPEAAVEEWGFDPAGLSVRGATQCPYSGVTVTSKDAKSAGKGGHLGELLLGAACVEPGKRGKVYVPASAVPLPDRGEIEAKISQLLARTEITVPREPLPEKLTGGMCSAYGLDDFGKLFTSRQTLLLLTVAEAIQRAHRMLSDQEDPEFAEAVSSYLGLLLGRLADRGSTLCHWDNTAEKTANTYARQALPMVWDFSEANPFGGASGDASMQLNFILEVLQHAASSAPGLPAQVMRGRAQRLPLADGSVDAVVTDPPYYDNISYADLSDFFYVWHKRALGQILPDVYGTTVTPKKAEAVVAPHRHAGKKREAARFYENEMAQAFSEAHRVLKAGAPLVVVYAHKTTLGWSTLVEALRKAGFQVTEAWPLNTEMPDRAGQMNTASLASSIFLVARKRSVGVGTGDYATQVRPAMMDVVENRVDALMAAGINGADLIIASVGAALAPYTRFDDVEMANGEVLPAEPFLEEVQREVLEAVLTRVFHVDRSGVKQVDASSRFYVLGRYQYGGGKIEFGEVNVMAQGIGVELTGPGSLSDGSGRLVKVTKSKVEFLDFADRGKAPHLGETGAAGPAPLIDALHRLLWLNEHDRPKIPKFLEKSQVDLGRLRLLAQALAGKALAAEDDEARTDEQKAIDRLLARWDRLGSNEDLPLFSRAR